MNADSGGAERSPFTTEPRRIPLHDRDGAIVAFALVDSDDYSRFAGHNWSLKPAKHGIGYAYRAERRGEHRRGAPQRIYLHREVMGIERGDRRRQVDHISHDTLDNRKGNLRTCTHAQNHQNKKGWDNATSSYRGVSWDRSRGVWKAQATLNYKNLLLGRYPIELDAARACEAFRRAHMPHSIFDWSLDPVPPCPCKGCRSSD